jgi:FAD/FMN-containing dehydrogenase
MAVVARGGGMSYTRGYQPEREGSLLLDVRRVNRVPRNRRRRGMYAQGGSGR